MRRRLLTLCLLAIPNLANSLSSSRIKVTVDAYGEYVQQPLCSFEKEGRVCRYMFSVGFCVTRSTMMGNARTLDSGTGNGQDSHAFSFLRLNKTNNLQPTIIKAVRWVSRQPSSHWFLAIKRRNRPKGRMCTLLRSLFHAQKAARDSEQSILVVRRLVSKDTFILNIT